ncbi:MAG TPA: hypothetical protein VGG15_00405 [Terriglobales bacterium]|jgi:hypothetical protein
MNSTIADRIQLLVTALVVGGLLIQAFVLQSIIEKCCNLASAGTADPSSG